MPLFLIGPQASCSTLLLIASTTAVFDVLSARSMDVRTVIVIFPPPPCRLFSTNFPQNILVFVADHILIMIDS